MIPAAEQVADALRRPVRGRGLAQLRRRLRPHAAWPGAPTSTAAWPKLASAYDERFRRMWRYYLAVSAAAFRSRRNQLWQLVLSARGVPGGYRAPR